MNRPANRTTDRRQTLTPPEVAARWKVKPETVLAAIRSGRLAAFTLSPPGCRRPRWRISLAIIEAYESGQAVQPVKRRRRRPTDGEVIQFF